MNSGQLLYTITVIHTINFGNCFSKYVFSRKDGVRYNGGILERYGQRSVQEEDCRRACRLTRECWGFNMEWLGPVGGVGYCELVDRTTMDTGLVPDTSRSFFGM